ncbi:MAG: GNAT family N-acetyltransferase [Planctomycetota bacterium]|jgi:RimJ/RimL family protein N-acetyltransferase
MSDQVQIVSSVEREFTDDEIAGFHEFTRDPEQMRWDPGEEELDLPDLFVFFREILPRRPGQAIFLAKEDEKVVGMSGLFVHRESEETGEAKLGFGVLGPWQGRGAARSLMEQAVDHAREQGIKKVVAEVLPHNLKAIQLLTRKGFQIVTPSEPDTDGPSVAVFELLLDDGSGGGETIGAS